MDLLNIVYFLLLSMYVRRSAVLLDNKVILLSKGEQLLLQYNLLVPVPIDATSLAFAYELAVGLTLYPIRFRALSSTSEA